MQSRGGGGGGGGAGGRGGRGGGPAGQDRPKREPILELSRYVDKRIRVKFSGYREVTGTLKGYDQLLNLVLDDTQEFLRGAPGLWQTKRKFPPLTRAHSRSAGWCCLTDPQDMTRVMEQTRELGLVVCRGTLITLICPVDGMEEIGPWGYSRLNAV